jgi:hypothetical protein
MELSISQDEVKDYLKLKTLSRLTQLKEKIRLFNQKYNMNFTQFELSVKNSEEDFEKWDDYIEWKAYEDFQNDLLVKLREIENARDIKIIR